MGSGGLWWAIVGSGGLWWALVGYGGLLWALVGSGCLLEVTCRGLEIAACHLPFG